MLWRGIVNAGGSARQMSNLQLRVISSVVLIVVVLALTCLGGLAFRLLSAAIAGAIFYEWCAMSRTASSGRYQPVAAALLAVVLVALVLGYSAPGILVLLALSVLACLLDGKLGGQGLWAPAGLAYAGLSGVSLAFLRDGDQAGLVAILFLFAVVWATDIFAYFVGRRSAGRSSRRRSRPARRGAARSAARSAACSPASLRCLRRA